MTENFEAVRLLLVQDCRCTIRMLAEHFHDVKETERSIITVNFINKKVYVRFVLHALTAEQREELVTSSEDLLKICYNDPELSNTIVTSDKS